jgi:transposase InsO family protein
MPWKESSVMDERIRFVIRLKDGESMASLCREFGISRKTGYKIFERYEECGLEGLTDRARRPHRYANQLPEQIEAAIVASKREKPNWGARKIRERLLRRLPHEVKVPACSTIHAILDRHGLVSRTKRSRTRAEGTPLSRGLSPNELWCTDYKGEFKLGNHRYCYPLTVTDHASRYLLLCEAMGSNQEQFAFTAFERLFQDAVYRKPSAQTMAFPSLPRTVSSISPSFPSGGCVWASASNASSPATRNRMAGMSACI